MRRWELRAATEVIRYGMIRTALMLSLFSTASFAQTYSVVPVQVPNGFTSVGMHGINNSGQVAGAGYNGATQQAFIGTPSGGAPIPLPTGWSQMYAQAINASGQVAGWGYNGTTPQAFIGSTPIPLINGWSNARAFAINNSGQVTGYGLNAVGASQAFIATTSGSTAIPLPLGYSGTVGSAINSSGQVAGWAYIPFPSFDTQAFIGTAAGGAVIPLPTGWASAYGEAINDSGQMAGRLFRIVANVPQNQPYIGTATVSSLIPLPNSATFGEIGSLNNLGMVVGYSDVSGWVWDATNGTRLLNSLVPSGWTVSGGVSISDNGLILAEASYQGGASQYVELIPAGLSPTPAPSTLALVLIGAALCCAPGRPVLVGSVKWVRESVLPSLHQVISSRAIALADSAKSFELKSSSSHKQINNKDNEQNTADAAPDHWASIVVTAPASKKQQENQNDEN
jgi:hypothetical protein